MKKLLRMIGYNKCKLCSLNCYGGCESSYGWLDDCFKYIVKGIINKITTGKYVRYTKLAKHT